MLQVKIEDDRYWNITFKKGDNWNQLVLVNIMFYSIAN